MADLRVAPDPIDEEVAAIVAAVEMAWPRAGVPEPEHETPKWRWSGRWWSRPIPVRRNRPW